MRFMNRDTVAGSITDSQSLNRFSYVEGNPLTYVDLNGQARTWITEHAQSILLYTELGLAGLGMIPILSDVTNVLLIGMDLSVGDFGGVALDAVGLIPFGNDVTNSMRLASISAKIGKTAGTAEKVNVAEKAVKASKIEGKTIEKADLPSWVADSFEKSEYKTIKTTKDVHVYRDFGGNASKTGGFSTTKPANNRISAKIDNALLPEWKNTREYEADILVPKGSILNVGKVAPQTIKETGTVLDGGVDQILLPQGWDENWIQSIRNLKP